MRAPPTALFHCRPMRLAAAQNDLRGKGRLMARRSFWRGRVFVGC